MDTNRQPNDEQNALWNGPAGRAWVDEQDLLDRVLQPFQDLLANEARALSPQRVLDVGCGAGATTLAVAQLIGAQGRCVGADISAPLIAAAQARAAREGSPARFIRADVQSHAFEPASFDLVMSRFGVMFFDDPVVAFANLRRAASGDAQLRLIAWRGAAENPFMTTAERAAAPLLPNLPPRRPGAPGQFSFADRDRVASILEQSGWRGIGIEPVDARCTLPETELVGYFTRLGPVGMVLQDADEHTRTQVIRAVRAAFDPFVHETEVRFDAACWMIRASA
jgi:SAM-dependent methyltransferase